MGWYQDANASDARVPLSVIWTLAVGALTGLCVAMFKLAWRGAMADFEHRITELENEIRRIREAQEYNR